VIDVVVIRHAQSQANAGVAISDPSTIALSTVGQAQAAALATSPLADAIVARARQWRSGAGGGRRVVLVRSAMARTGATLAPLVTRLEREVADAGGGTTRMGTPTDWPVEIWPIHEFTFLSYARLLASHGATTSEQRREIARPYWEACDPTSRDGEDAESFAMFRARIRGVRERLSALARERGKDGPPSLVVIVAHNRAMMMLQQVCAWPCIDDAAAMRRFRAEIFSGVDVPNVGVLPLRVDDAGGVWVGGVGDAAGTPGW
jgi:broad specificity phosphatase PhoE